MNIEEKYTLYKDFYEFEFQQKNFIISRLTTAYTVTIIVGGAGAYFLKNLNLCSIGALEIVFFSLFVPFAVCLLGAFYCLKKCFFTYRYGYPSEAEEFQRYIEDYEKLNKEVAEDKKHNIKDKVQQSLSKQYCKCATELRRHNKNRNLWFLRAIRATYFAVIFLFIMTPLFFAQKYQIQQEHDLHNKISVQQIQETKAMCDKGKDVEPKEPKEPEIDHVMEHREVYGDAAAKDAEAKEEAIEETNNEDE